MSALPTFQNSDRDFQLLQSRWKSILDPLIAQPQASGSILKGIPLAIGSNVVNHLLSRMQQGWSIVDINGAATIYRSAPFNSQTLTLTSDAAVTVDILVF